MPRKRRPSETVPRGFYVEQFNRQKGVCAICGASPKTRRLHIDHDHDTGLIRGLLCFSCNRLLLHRRLTPELLRAAADYLENPPAGAAAGSV